MNRSVYFNYIVDKLSNLAYKIELRGRLNILDYHLHSENFYLHLLNLLFSWELENLNATRQNIEAIDLIDHTNKIVIQVSSTCTKAKIESSLSKKIISKYSAYNFKFISLSKESSRLRNAIYKNPYQIQFLPLSDIYDIKSISDLIMSLDIEQQKIIYQLIKHELGGEVDIVRLESNLATVINILSKENWGNNTSSLNTNSFEIERKISHNNLNLTIDFINDYGIHGGRVNRIYSEFDLLGYNKSASVLDGIKAIYLKAKANLSDDDLFFDIIEKVQEKVLNSLNYIQIPIDELELCAKILVVDAFIRCKIFENPENYNYVATR